MNTPRNHFLSDDVVRAGCTMVPGGSWRSAPTDAYICGLKELPEHDTTPLIHKHIFFAHCFKDQAGWEDILSRFSKGGGQLFDLEFLNDERGRRVAAFGFYAGFTGGAFGIDAWCQQQLTNTASYPPIKPFPDEASLIAHVRGNLQRVLDKNNGVYPRVMVMGALGRCGSGAVDCARKVGIPDDCILQWDMAETAAGGPFQAIVDADVFVNCIYLFKPIPPFVTREQLGQPARKLSMIVDVSCDTTNPHNPIPIYSSNTTFDHPTMVVDSASPTPLELMAIDHLPTALPRESSDAFTRDLLPYLLQLPKIIESSTWMGALRLFEDKAKLAQV